MRQRVLAFGCAILAACTELAAGEDILPTTGDAAAPALANLASDGATPCHLVKQRAQLFDEDGTTSCSFTPVPELVCIDGFCGDGRCEPPEALPCGCSLDCAIPD